MYSSKSTVYRQEQIFQMERQDTELNTVLTYPSICQMHLKNTVVYNYTI